MARDLGIANESLRRWILQTAIDQGEAPGLTSDEHAELIRLGHETTSECNTVSRSVALTG